MLIQHFVFIKLIKKVSNLNTREIIINFQCVYIYVNFIIMKLPYLLICIVTRVYNVCPSKYNAHIPKIIQRLLYNRESFEFHER